MKEVKSVELILENCEVLKFLPDQIGVFCCNNITARVARVACNSISKLLVCEWMGIELYGTTNQKYDSFGQESEYRVFDRLMKFTDITAVEVTYEDDSSDYILVPWSDESEYSNKYQTGFVSASGNLCILISKETFAENFFGELEA